MNEGSWCFDNVLEELNNLSNRAGCLCSFSNAEYIREATEDDEEEFEKRILDIWKEQNND